jgi:hypothetical protein
MSLRQTVTTGNLYAGNRNREADTFRRKLFSDIAILSSPETLRQPSSGSWRVDEDPLRGAYLTLIEDGLTADIHCMSWS